MLEFWKTVIAQFYYQSDKFVPNTSDINASLHFFLFSNPKIKRETSKSTLGSFFWFCLFYDNTFCGKHCVPKILYSYTIASLFHLLQLKMILLQTHLIRCHKNVLYLRTMFLFHNLVFTLSLKANCKNIIPCIISFIMLFEWAFVCFKTGCKCWCWSFRFCIRW